MREWFFLIHHRHVALVADAAERPNVFRPSSSYVVAIRLSLVLFVCARFFPICNRLFLLNHCNIRLL